MVHVKPRQMNGASSLSPPTLVTRRGVIDPSLHPNLQATSKLRKLWVIQLSRNNCNIFLSCDLETRMVWKLETSVSTCKESRGFSKWGLGSAEMIVVYEEETWWRLHPHRVQDHKLGAFVFELVTKNKGFITEHAKPFGSSFGHFGNDIGTIGAGEKGFLGSWWRGCGVGYWWDLWVGWW